jgi:hypothetical protein
MGGAGNSSLTSHQPHLMKSHSHLPPQSASTAPLRVSNNNHPTSLATIDLMANVASVTSAANNHSVLGGITNTHESNNSRPGSLGGGNVNSSTTVSGIINKKNQSVEINVAGLPKHTSYSNSSGRNTTMNQSTSHLKVSNPHLNKEIAH